MNIYHKLWLYVSFCHLLIKRVLPRLLYFLIHQILFYIISEISGLLVFFHLDSYWCSLITLLNHGYLNTYFHIRWVKKRTNNRWACPGASFVLMSLIAENDPWDRLITTSVLQIRTLSFREISTQRVGSYSRNQLCARSPPEAVPPHHGALNPIFSLVYVFRCI